jgi:hypothetical protein
LSRFCPQRGPAHDAVYFDDFSTTLSFTKMFKKISPNDILRVRTPSTATREELDELKENGCIPV